MIELREAKWFQILCASVAMVHIFLGFRYSKEVKIERLANCSKTSRRFSANPRWPRPDLIYLRRVDEQGTLCLNTASMLHTSKKGICTSESGTPGVDSTAGAEYLAFSSLIGAFLHPDMMSLAEDLQFGGFFHWARQQPSCCSAFPLVNNLYKIVLLQRGWEKCETTAHLLVKAYLTCLWA
jgi:hypothetical protein